MSSDEDGDSDVSADFLVEVKIDGNKVTMEVTEEDTFRDGKKEPVGGSSLENGDLVSFSDFPIKNGKPKIVECSPK